MLFRDLERFWILFTTLSSQRQAGFNGPQPISLTDLKSASDMMGFDKADDFEFILIAIPKLDQIYLTHTYEERDKKAKANAKNKPPPPRRNRRR